MTSRATEAKAPGEGEISYGRYLKVTELIGLQELLSEPQVHDELLFITVHQAYELWFKQILFELESVRDALTAGRIDEARHELDRVLRIERLLVAQVDVIESMRFQDFLEFRDALNPASGFQSVQFREIEAISGLKDDSHLRLAETEAEQARLRRRLEEPSVWDAFRAAMDATELPMPEDDEERRTASLLELMSRRPEHRELWEVSEAMVEHDQLLAMWRWRHVLMVERQIGAKIGTGGSAGAAYLRGTIESRLFPELWNVRSDYTIPDREREE